MIKLEQLAQICDGMAWAAEVIPYKTQDFHVDVHLPFPFYEAIQKELAEMVNASPVKMPDAVQPMKFMDIYFPSGITAHIKQSDGPILIERTQPGKVVKMDQVFLSPNGGANNRA